MSETKRTPGPWRTITRTDGLVNVYHLNREVALCVRKEDAPIITAAPELLNAVEYLLTIINRDNPKLNGVMEVDYARAAIAKANGEV